MNLVKQYIKFSFNISHLLSVLDPTSAFGKRNYQLSLELNSQILYQAGYLKLLDLEMSAYATLVSLANLIEQIQLYHAHYPTFLDEHQKQLISLHKKVTNLQDLLEWCSLQGFKDVSDLVSRIADAAVGAEDIVESYVVDDIRSRSWKERIMSSPVNFINVFHKVDTTLFSEQLHQSIECMDLMEKEMMNIKEKSISKGQQRLPDLKSTVSPKFPTDGNNFMVGFDNEFNEIMSKLTGHGSSLKIISITGMGGIGKSTLARSVCDNRSTINYFDVRGWIIVSQAFNVKNRLFDLLKEIEVIKGESDEENYDYHQLGEKLYKHLCGRRFLIIVDDIWNAEDWAKFKLFLPDNNNGSRIIVTTRSLNVVKDLGSSDIYSVNFLDENTSWSLLCRKVFLNEPCPPKLLEVGKTIAKNCKGLPLSLSVIGGLLAKLEKKCECWEKICEDINTIVSSEEDERYLKILALSYSHLPIYLKPCFLYMGIFPEDHSIGVESLIDLWIAEGFLKLRGASKSMEDVAKDYMEDLIARNLIYSVSGIERSGKTQKVIIHDLLRDLAVKESQNEKFLGVATLHDPNFSMIVTSERRVRLHNSKLSANLKSEYEEAMNSSTSLRSLICDTAVMLPVTHGNRLLRVSKLACFSYSQKDTLHLINSRHLLLSYDHAFELSSLQLLWNLQIISISNIVLETADFPIWKMPLLRKLDMPGVSLPDPPVDGKGDIVLANLQKISVVLDFRCTDEVLRRIPNIKEMFLIYLNESKKEASRYCPSNFCHLNKLETLFFLIAKDMEWLTRINWFQSLGFPLSLRKLILTNCGFEWENLTTKVGSLPLLEDLHFFDCYTGEEWILDEEGTFLCLKFLQIAGCSNLVRWSAESIHFPCLEDLLLAELESLEEIPFEIGEIASLQSINLEECSKSIVASAKMILKEQRSFGNDGLRVMVNQKHLQVDEEEECEGVGENEEDEVVQDEQVKKRSKGFVAFVVPFLVVLGFGFVLFRKKIGGKGIGIGRGVEIVKPKNDNDRELQRKADDDSWFLSYDYP